MSDQSEKSLIVVASVQPVSTWVQCVWHVLSAPLAHGVATTSPLKRSQNVASSQVPPSPQ